MSVALLDARNIGADPEVFTKIFDADTNIAVWQRALPAAVRAAASAALLADPHLKAAEVVSPDSVADVIAKALGNTQELRPLCDDVALLVDMFCCLLDVPQAGLRLVSLDRAMCPRFHVDRVPARLVTTYVGKATQWLPHARVDRTKLGVGAAGLSDETSGLYSPQLPAPQLEVGDVALLKGETWPGNEGAGLVHRSPPVAEGERRLLLTLDLVGY